MLPFRECLSLCKLCQLYGSDLKRQAQKLPHTCMPKAWQQDQPVEVSFLQHSA